MSVICGLVAPIVIRLGWWWSLLLLPPVIWMMRDGIWLRKKQDRIMKNITTIELQLLECFGVEPLLLDAAIPWCYNDAA